jgi:hypothetical protein
MGYSITFLLDFIFKLFAKQRTRDEFVFQINGDLDEKLVRSQG